MVSVQCLLCSKKISLRTTKRSANITNYECHLNFVHQERFRNNFRMSLLAMRLSKTHKKNETLSHKTGNFEFVTTEGEVELNSTF